MLLLFTLFSCKKQQDFSDLKGDKWNPSLAVPLINSQVSIEDILIRSGENENLDNDFSGKLAVHYQTRLFSIEGKDLFKIPDLSGVLNSLNNSFNFNFPGSTQVSEFKLKSGELDYAITTPDNEPGEITIIIEDATNSEGVFTEKIEIGGDHGQYHSGSFDLSGFEFDLSNNNITIQYLVDLASGLSVNLEDYPFLINIRDLVYEYSIGFFDGLNFGSFADTLDLNLFKNWIKGSLEINNPSISFFLENSFGFPILAEFSTMESVNHHEDDEVIALESSLSLGDSVEIEFPNLFNIGETETTSIEFDDNNSNLSNLISISPQEFRFALFFKKKVEVDSSNFNFLTEDSQFSLDVDLRLPISGKIQDVLVRDTIPFEASTESLFKTLNQAKFRIETINKLPIDLKMQIYFADENDQVLDSLFQDSQNLLSSGEINSSGRVIDPTNEVNFVTLDNEKALGIENSRKLFVEIQLNSAEDGNATVEFYEDYFIGIKLGVIADTQMD